TSLDKQQEIVAKYLKDIESIDTESAPLGVELTMLPSAILEQKSYLINLSSMEQRKAISLGNNSALDSNFPRGYREQEDVEGARLEFWPRLWKLLNPLPEAFAVFKKKLHPEQWWAQ